VSLSSSRDSEGDNGPISPDVPIASLLGRVAFEGLRSVELVASCVEVAGNRETAFQDCRLAPVEPCLFLDLKPRGRYVMRHSWGNPRRKHCVQGAVPLHFFLLSRQNEHAVQSKMCKSASFVRRRNLDTDTTLTLCRSLSLRLLDFRAWHVAVNYLRF
jgi:hypothetical protein